MELPVLCLPIKVGVLRSAAHYHNCQQRTTRVMSPDKCTFKPLRVVGLMSGTSMDGIDAAYMETDGENELSVGPFLTLPYETKFRSKLSQFIKSARERGSIPAEAKLEEELTDLHECAVKILLAKMGRAVSEVDLVGFHGQTIWHRPNQRQTWQMGNGERLATALNIPLPSISGAPMSKGGGRERPWLQYSMARWRRTWSFRSRL